jgi:hypothetical protein
MEARDFYIGNGPKGLGVYANRTILPSERILTFTGPLIDFLGTLALGEREGDALQIGLDLYIHLDQPGRFVNHSCRPNAGIVEDRILVALSPIFPDDEICYDYSTTMKEDHWTMACLCSSPACRREIRDFTTLSQDLQQWYLGRGIVQRFLTPQPATVPHALCLSVPEVSI